MRCRTSKLLRYVAVCVILILVKTLFQELFMNGLSEDSTDFSSRKYRHYPTIGNDTVTYLPPGSPPVLVAMVTYQRSGSSFLGEVFNQNPAAFEWFEPLDGLYSAMYGTEYGHNVPADIWNHWDGTVRELPDYEVEALSRVANRILSCQFSTLPTEVLFHHFLGMFINEHQRLRPYHSCAMDNASTQQAGHTITKCKMCNTRLARVCGRRFGQSSWKQSKCAAVLLKELFPGDSTWQKYIEDLLPKTEVDVVVAQAMAHYRKCMVPCRTRALKCLPHLQTVCESAAVRAIKPVRFPMEAAERLLEVVPEVKIIQNLRDPRGVVASRKNTSESFQAAYAGALLKPKNVKHDILKEAVLFCRNAHKDVAIFRDVQKEHPLSVLQVIYERNALNPRATARDIYDFLQLPLPVEVAVWLEENTTNGTAHGKQTTRNSKLTASRWQHQLKSDTVNAINKVCTNLFNLFNVTETNNWTWT